MPTETPPAAHTPGPWDFIFLTRGPGFIGADGQRVGMTAAATWAVEALGFGLGLGCFIAGLVVL